MFSKFGTINGSGGTSGAAVSAPIAGPRSGGAAGAWHPTILGLLVLVACEIVVAGFLSRHLLR